ncbi:glycosyltransferase family 4 protein [Croceicoccus hydrothermalis]|uniref:glycosyltransferase family 4 protein n=1 Tax=Croceicoccus hydrothermalis TaxID=2867964 RepID=UPI001EFA4043|nr:glycosyltransferase family 4 protein [Croceicoccus hydrothermalis]
MIVMAICHYDDTNSSGGLDKQARLLSRTMQAAGTDVIMLASTRKWSRAGWTIDEGVRVRYFWTYASPQVSGRYLPAALIWAFQILLWVFLNRRIIDVFHCHQIRIHAFVAAIASKFFKIPSLLKSATGGEGADIKAIGSRKYFGAVGRRFVAKNVTCFVATTAAIKQDLTSHGVNEAKVALIPNGLVLPTRKSSRERDATRASKALFLGRLADDKNVVTLADAAISLGNSSRLTVDIWGKGPLQNRLENTIETAPASSHVHYRGFSSDPSQLLERYGYILIASSAEGLSNSMLEAMAHGVVPLATQVSGCIDHIEPNVRGFFFENSDREALLAGLRQISEVDDRHWAEMSRNVEAYAYEHFDIRNVVNSYLILYDKLNVQKVKA